MTPLAEFYHGLGAKERRWLVLEFPKLLDRWLDNSIDSKATDWLVLGTSYRYYDALAIALSHLKEIYPFWLPSTLYRHTGVEELPGTSKVVIGKGSIARKPLLSWTSLRTPWIEGRSSKPNDIILAWKPVPKYVLASHESLKDILRDFTYLTAKNVIARKYVRRASLSLASYEGEKEYMVYLSKPIECTWREA